MAARVGWGLVGSTEEQVYLPIPDQRITHGLGREMRGAVESAPRYSGFVRTNTSDIASPQLHVRLPVQISVADRLRLGVGRG